MKTPEGASMSSNAPTEIAPDVFRLGTPIVNWYLVADGDRLTAIDAGLPAYAETLQADLAALGFALDAVDAVVLTHSDSDHTGLAQRMRDAGARVLIHSGDAETLAKPGPKSGDAAPIKLVPQMWRPRFWRFMGHMTRSGGARPPHIEGADGFSDGDLLDVPGRPRVLHTPGHTPGHCALLLEDRGVLFVGDSLCTWNPLTGVRRPQLMPKAFNADNRACAESLERLARVDAQVLLPGHGDPFHGTPATAVEQARR
jgi:glyoxylase-like metal-dependent hydrolase (beta-lactamase superfamily II)